MKPLFNIIALVFVFALNSEMAFSSSSIPHLKKQGKATQLIVDGQPMLLLGGELHNSSASSLEFMKPVWNKLQSINVNTVLATLAWEQIEPVEGEFDFTLIDGLVEQARLRDLKLIFLWFGSWKNGESSYVPAWVKKDTQRFQRCFNQEQRKTNVLSPFCKTTQEADARAFAAVLKHIKTIDSEHHTVIMMQIENEVGLLSQSRDYNPISEKVFHQSVPQTLIDFLADRKETLLPHLQKTWASTNYKTVGSWQDVFGKSIATDEIFMAWHFASYINAIAEKGKAEYALPMFVNAWLAGDGEPGTYPSGGPVARVHDIWRAAAPAIDLIAPDIYLPTFKEICHNFVRSGNPLLIPEIRRDEIVAAKAWWAFGQMKAIGFSPFGIESIDEENPLIDTYDKLNQLMPLITKFQSAGRIAGIYKQDNEDQDSSSVEMGDWRVTIHYNHPVKNKTAMGMIIQTGEDEFIVAGNWFYLKFDPAFTIPSYGGILQVDEGYFSEGIWKPLRRLNGDETHVNKLVNLPPYHPFVDNTFQNIEKTRILKVQLYRYD